MPPESQLELARRVLTGRDLPDYAEVVRLAQAVIDAEAETTKRIVAAIRGLSTDLTNTMTTEWCANWIAKGCPDE